MALLGSLSSEFQTSFPYGLSRESYGVLIALPLVLGQWFLIGFGMERIVDRLRVAGQDHGKSTASPRHS